MCVLGGGVAVIGRRKNGREHSHDVVVSQVPMRDGESQTDFVDEEWRPMTEDDVGTEAVSPKPPPAQAADSASQYDYGFGYGTAAGAMSPSG